MNIHFPLSILLFFLILFSMSCSREMENVLEEIELAETRWLSSPPLNRTLKDSLRIALEYAINISEADLSDIANDPSWFHYEYDDNQNAVVKVILARPYMVIINRNLIRQYGWNGFLLIALHEWFHIYMAFRMNNDETHETMVAENSLYILWIQQTFNCSALNAKYLAYVGTENTAPYEKLSKDEKENMKKVAQGYHILK